MHIKLYQLIISTALLLYTCCSFSEPNSVDDYKTTLMQVYKQYQNEHSGKNATYIPELAKANPNHFAISIATVDGQLFTVGDAEIAFSIQSISKIFAYALALEDNDHDTLFHEIGLDATGEKFNSIAPVEKGQASSLNPYVNAGAIQTTSYIKGKNSAEKWARFFAFLQTFGDGKLVLSQRIYQSETETNIRNHAIAHLLKSHGKLRGDPKDVLDRYTKACAVMVTSNQLALMGATLANNGKNPLTQQQVISPTVTRHVLSQMLVNGLYEKSGTWVVTIGVPAKSGVGGGILAIVPNKMAIAVYSPPLDAAGNSVRGQKVLEALSNIWGLHLLDK